MKHEFCGYYFKCQSPEHTIALIPSFHRQGREERASFQLITDSGACNFSYPGREWRKEPGRLSVSLGGNRFCGRYIRLHQKQSGLSVEGMLQFGPLSPIRYDIMGPFQYVPMMECRHSIYSMRHRVDGYLTINQTSYRFHNAIGYIEGDRGCSFPRRYLWTQCLFGRHSLMLSIADIPFGPLSFTGVIGIIYWKGMEYRLATYLGARIVKAEKGEFVIRQGEYQFTARLLESNAHPLLAPTQGLMRRTIHESASCHAFYRFQKGKRLLFSLDSHYASFEDEFSSSLSCERGFPSGIC